eukprot:scaffold264147_cov30-Tisochrysis_lutea.AAC.3
MLLWAFWESSADGRSHTSSGSCASSRRAPGHRNQDSKRDAHILAKGDSYLWCFAALPRVAVPPGKWTGSGVACTWSRFSVSQHRCSITRPSASLAGVLVFASHSLHRAMSDKWSARREPLIMSWLLARAA